MALRVNPISKIRDIRESLLVEQKRKLRIAACGLWISSVWAAQLGSTLILVFAKSFPYSRLVFGVTLTVLLMGAVALAILVLPRLPRGEFRMPGRAWRAPPLLFIALIGASVGSVYGGDSVLVPSLVLVLFGVVSFVVSTFLLALSL